MSISIHKYLLISLSILFFALFFISRNISFAATRTWDGEGTTNNWSEAANWSGNVVPGSSDDAIFNNTSIKNSVWDSAGPAQIISLNVQSSYSGSLTLGRDVSVSGNWTFAGSGSLNAQTSTLKFVYYSSTFTPGAANYYNIEVAKNSGSSLTVSSTAIVVNNLTISGAGNSINTGSINVSGDITITATSDSGGGSGTININGTGDQSLSSAGGYLPNIIINKPSGTLYLSGTIPIQRNWTWQFGNINAQTSLLKFVYTSTQYFTAGPYSYYAIEIAGSSYANIQIQGQATTTNFIASNIGNIATGTLNITGNISITATSGGGGLGTININGAGDQTLSSAGWALPNVIINKPSGTLYLSGAIPIFGNWTWQLGIINSQNSTLKFVSPYVTNFTAGPFNYYNLEIKGRDNYSAVYLRSNVNLNNYLNIVIGYLVQNNYNLQVNNAVTVSQNGAWQNYSTGTSYVYVGNEGVTNNGYIDFNGGSDYNCTGVDSVLIRSTANGIKRSWSGNGTFRMRDVDVKDQNGTAIIVVAQGANSGNNGSNWIFDNDPLNYIYKANLTSSVFDSQVVGGSSLNSIMFQSTGVSVSSLVKFQITSSNASSGPWSFMGPDGTSATYYVPSNGGVGYVVPINPIQHSNKRYFRYKIFLETDTCRSISPKVKGVIINWAL